MNIVLFGIKGCGKTTLGKLIAKKLERAFMDTDFLIEETYHLNHSKKLSCQEIYQKVGFMTFRALEYEVIQSLQDVQRSVIAVGGGAMLLYENIEALKKSSNLIYLYFDREKLKARVLSGPLPAFIDPDHSDASFDRMYEERHEFYKKIKAHLVDITALTENEAVQLICERVKNGK